MGRRSAHLPASEVLRFGGHVFARLLAATLFGLIFLKLGQHLSGWPAADAVLYGEIITAATFISAFLFWPVPWPELDLGEAPEQTEA